MVTIYYLVQEILGHKNKEGISAPYEGGLGVAAINMLRAASRAPRDDGVDFRVVLPGTQDVLDYFKINKGICNSRDASLFQVRMPVSGEIVYVALDKQLGCVQNFAQSVRRADGFLCSETMSKILLGTLKGRDIVHLNGWHFYTVGRDIKARGNKNPVILNIHIIRDIYRHRFDSTVINPWETVIASSDVLVPVSRAYAQQIVAGANEPLSQKIVALINQKPIVGINNGLDDMTMPAAVGNKCNEIAWIHRIDSRQKGLDLLRDVVQWLVCSDAGWKINILGSVEEGDEKAREFVDELSELQRQNPHLVSFDTGFTFQKKEDILRRSKVFLCTSSYEGSPYSVMEAMRFGLVSVVTPKGGLIDLVKDNKTGFVAQEMNCGAFRSSLMRAFDACDSERYAYMVGAAQHMVPTADEMFTDYTNLYRSCVSWDRSNGGMFFSAAPSFPNTLPSRLSPSQFAQS